MFTLVVVCCSVCGSALFWDIDGYDGYAMDSSVVVQHVSTCGSSSTELHLWSPIRSESAAPQLNAEATPTTVRGNAK